MSQNNIKLSDYIVFPLWLNIKKKKKDMSCFQKAYQA